MLAQGFQLGPKSRRTFFSRSLYRVDLSISLPRASRLSSSASFQLVMAPIQKLQCYREMGPAYLPVPTAITCVPQFISGRDLSRSRVPKVEKICRRPRLPARTRRRYISYRRTERSVPDGRTDILSNIFRPSCFRSYRPPQAKSGPDARNVDARQRSEDEVRYICGYPWKPSARCECH